MLEPLGINFSEMEEMKNWNYDSEWENSRESWCNNNKKY